MTAPETGPSVRRIGDRYLLGEPLGRGGMGRVFRAHDELLNRDVAVKLLYRDTISDDELQHTCAAEARAAARLNHPGIVRILDSGVEDGQCFVIMELAAGTSLATILEQCAPVPVSEALAIAQQAADALQAAHEAGVIHCDVKPGNLMVSPDGHVQLVDFGIARVATATTGLLDATPQGSARYVAPEQVEGGKLDGRTDVYALGIVLYEMLAGQAPFDGGSIASILARRLVVDPPPVHRSRAEVPPAVEAVVLRALARAPADRYPSAGAFRDAIRDVRSPRPVAGPAGLAAVPIAALARLQPTRVLNSVSRAGDRLAALQPRTVAVLASVLVAVVLTSLLIVRVGVDAASMDATVAEAVEAPADPPPSEATNAHDVTAAVPRVVVVPPTTIPATATPLPTTEPTIEAAPPDPPAQAPAPAAPITHRPSVAPRVVPERPAREDEGRDDDGDDDRDDRDDDDDDDGDDDDDDDEGARARQGRTPAPEVEVLRVDRRVPAAPKPQPAAKPVSNEPDKDRDRDEDKNKEQASKEQGPKKSEQERGRDNGNDKKNR